MCLYVIRSGVCPATAITRPVFIVALSAVCGVFLRVVIVDKVTEDSEAHNRAARVLIEIN